MSYKAWSNRVLCAASLRGVGGYSSTCTLEATSQNHFPMPMCGGKLTCEQQGITETPQKPSHCLCITCTLACALFL